MKFWEISFEIEGEILFSKRSVQIMVEQRSEAEIYLRRSFGLKESEIQKAEWKPMEYPNYILVRSSSGIWIEQKLI